MPPLFGSMIPEWLILLKQIRELLPLPLHFVGGVHSSQPPATFHIQGLHYKINATLNKR